MQLSRIEGNGVKVPYFDVKLSPITLVHGDNAKGKTAILIACRILLTGKNPLAKKAPIKVIGTMRNKTDILVREWRLQKDSARSAHDVPEGWPETPVVLLDPTDYLDRSERERVKYVAGMMSSDEQDGGFLIEKVKSIKFDEVTREIVLEHEAICEALDNADHQRHDDGVTVKEWVDGLVTEYAEKWSAAKASVERLKGFSSAQVQLQVTDKPEATRNVDGELKDKIEQFGRLHSEVDRLNRDAIAAKEQESLFKLLENRTKGEAELQVLLANTNDKIKTLETEIDGFVSQTSELREKLSAPVAQRSRLLAKRDGVNEQMRDVEAKIEIELGQTCQCCGLKSDACKAAARRIAGLRHELGEHCKQVAGFAIELTDLDQKITALQKAVTESEKAVSAITMKRGELMKLYQDQTSLSQRLNRIELDKAALAQKRLTAPDSETLSKKLSEVQELSNEIALLTAMQKRHAAAQQEEARRVQSLAELTKAEAYLIVVKAVREKINEAQEALVKKSFSKILEVLNKVADGLIATKIEYRDGEIGRTSGIAGEWISHRDFSGFEKAVCYMGVAAALAQSAPVKMVLIDDLIISRKNKVRLITRAADLIKSGVIDQLLITDCHPEDYASIVLPDPEMFSTIEVADGLIA